MKLLLKLNKSVEWWVADGKRYEISASLNDAKNKAMGRIRAFTLSGWVVVLDHVQEVVGATSSEQCIEVLDKYKKQLLEWTTAFHGPQG